MEQTELEKLCRWEGNKEVREDIISLASVRALAATLNYKPDDYNEGKLLPPLYHWLSFLDLTRLDELADDGHAEKGGFMPPVPFPRRMFAGGRIQFSGDLQIGEKVSRISTIKSVKHKKGRTGEIIFVTVSHQISNKDGFSHNPFSKPQGDISKLDVQKSGTFKKTQIRIGRFCIEHKPVLIDENDIVVFSYLVNFIEKEDCINLHDVTKFLYVI